MHNDFRSISLLYPTFATLTSHLFDANSLCRTWLLDYYLFVRELDIKGSTPLKDLYSTLPKELKLTLARILVFTPFARLGFFGGTSTPEFLEDLKIIANRLKQEDSVCPFNFATALGCVAKKSYMIPVCPYTTRKSDKSILKQAEVILADNTLTAFAINNDAMRLAKVTKSLLDIAQCTTPLDRCAKVAYHTNLFKNAFLSAEIAVPYDLLGDIRESYGSYRNFFPLCVFYSLCYQTSLGKHLVPSVETMGFILGFRGPNSARYSYIRSFGDTLGTFISKKYNLRYDRVCDIVFHAKNTNEAFTVSNQKSEVVDIRDLPRRDNPYRNSYVEGEGEVLGRSRGTYIIDHNCIDYEQKMTAMEHSFQFPYEVRFLSTRSRMTRSLKSSAFTRNHHLIKAFCTVVDVNPVTKPDLTKRPEVNDKRWLPIFDEYLKTDFSIAALAAVLKTDEVFFKKLQPKLLKLSRALKGKSLKDAEDLCKISYAGISFPSIIDAPYDAGDEGERYQMSLYKDMLDLWVEESKNPILPSPVTIVIKKLNNAKGRTVCRQPIVISLFESFANRVWQVIYQKINRGMGYPVSNYLPGLAVPLYSMERIADSLDGKDFAMCNMDVKSCFDNINLLHPNFLSALADGLSKIKDCVGEGPATFLSRMFKDYLYENTKLGMFKFKKSKLCPEVPIPKEGALPTGFVLSPALWLTLALPAILETHARVSEGTLFSFDLCGDDMIAVAPRGLSEALKAKVCEPWFTLANKLDLKFHFFKNYKDGRVHFNPKWSFLFDGNSPWVDRFPAYSVPVFHAGTILADKRHVETITALDPDKMEGKLYSALSKRVRDGGANFLPFIMMASLSLHPNLSNRLAGYTPPRRLSDQEEMDKEAKKFITGPQASVIPFFYKGLNRGKVGESVSKNRGWFLQIPDKLKKGVSPEDEAAARSAKNLAIIAGWTPPIEETRAEKSARNLAIIAGYGMPQAKKVEPTPEDLAKAKSAENYAIIASYGMEAVRLKIKPLSDTGEVLAKQDNPLFEQSVVWKRLKPLSELDEIPSRQG